jgi:hypothetical protein
MSNEDGVPSPPVEEGGAYTGKGAAQGVECSDLQADDVGASHERPMFRNFHQAVTCRRQQIERRLDFDRQSGGHMVPPNHDPTPSDAGAMPPRAEPRLGHTFIGGVSGHC